MFRFTLNKLMNEESGGDVSGGGAEPEGKTQDKPNENWQDDKRLDENGNPIEQPQEPTEQPPEEPTKEQESEEPVDKSEEPTEKLLGTPVVKQVESLLNDAGLNPAEVTKELVANDGQVTPELVKALAAKHGDAVASIVANQLSAFHKEHKATALKRDEAVYTQVQDAFKDITEQSGKETWAELSGWAKTNVPNEERKEINKLLQQGGIAAKYAIDDLINRFKSSNDFVQSADLVTGDKVSNEVGGLTPISQREYNQKFRELENKGLTYGQSSEFDKLDRQRMAGRNRGL